MESMKRWMTMTCEGWLHMATQKDPELSSSHRHARSTAACATRPPRNTRKEASESHTSGWGGNTARPRCGRRDTSPLGTPCGAANPNPRLSPRSRGLTPHIRHPDLESLPLRGEPPGLGSEDQRGPRLRDAQGTGPRRRWRGWRGWCGWCGLGLPRPRSEAARPSPGVL